MSSLVPGNDIFHKNPYESHPSLSQTEAEVLWEYAKLAQHAKEVQHNPILCRTMVALSRRPTAAEPPKPERELAGLGAVVRYLPAGGRAGEQDGPAVVTCGHYGVFGCPSQCDERERGHSDIENAAFGLDGVDGTIVTYDGVNSTTKSVGVGLTSVGLSSLPLEKIFKLLAEPSVLTHESHNAQTASLTRGSSPVSCLRDLKYECM
jgi:hypothetical protein